MVVSGHMDGGLRFWDLRTGGRTLDIAGTDIRVYVISSYGGFATYSAETKPFFSSRRASPGRCNISSFKSLQQLSSINEWA